MKPVTYILRCSDNSYYVGSTEDLEERLKLHNSGKGGRFTKLHKPVTLVYSEEFETYPEAFNRERQIHGWSRAKKEALIKGDISQLKNLSNSTSSSVTTSTSSTVTKSKGK